MSATGMMQRCWEHDYCAPCFYMITIVTEPRRDCLGVLKAETDGTASLEISPIGEIVKDIWRRTTAVYPGVEACECVLMPDHFHGIIWVKERLARPLGHIVKAFKRVSTGECRSRGLLPTQNPGSVPAAAPASGFVPAAAPAAGFPTLWQAGFQDSILSRRGQLKAMVNYIADNPRRLAVKRANADIFTVVDKLEVIPGKTCAAVGNRFLLQRPLKRQVQVSRRITSESLATLQAELRYAADHGAVLVSPCISPGEKTIARAALSDGKPLIVLVANGFPPLYKPAGCYFDACAAGHLLMLAPFPFDRRRKPLTRDQSMELNDWAKALVESSLLTDEFSLKSRLTLTTEVQR